MICWTIGNFNTGTNQTLFSLFWLLFPPLKTGICRCYDEVSTFVDSISIECVSISYLIFISVFIGTKAHNSTRRDGVLIKQTYNCQRDDSMHIWCSLIGHLWFFVNFVASWVVLLDSGNFPFYSTILRRLTRDFFFFLIFQIKLWDEKLLFI